MLYEQLNQLKPKMAIAAQLIYDEWDGSGFGICDEIADAISDIIASHIADVEIDEYGHEGDDHAAVIASLGNESYVVDIPPSIYEWGGGYNWHKIPDVMFDIDDIVIAQI